MQIMKVENIVRDYKKSRNSQEKTEVLKGITFSVWENEFLGIMGRSGCGKTTLLKILGMIDFPEKGKVWFKETDIDDISYEETKEIRRSRMGYVFQEFYLIDSLTVLENIGMPLILAKTETKEIVRRVTEMAERYHLLHLLKKKPRELSGGEKQRAAICRALIHNPEMILADEPTGNLDSKSGKIVIENLEQIYQEKGKAVLMVTHDPQMASRCSRVILLKDGVILEELKRTGRREDFYRTIIEKMEIL